MTIPVTPFDGEDQAPVTLLGRLLPAPLTRAVHVLGRGATLICDHSWRDVFAVVEHGTVEVETARGARLRLTEGGALCFALTGPVVLRASGGSRAVLATVRRTAPADGDR